MNDILIMQSLITVLIFLILSLSFRIIFQNNWKIINNLFLVLFTTFFSTCVIIIHMFLSIRDLQYVIKIGKTTESIGENIDHNLNYLILESFLFLISFSFLVFVVVKLLSDQKMK